ncbi:MAG: hypothetical protein PHH06_03950 [Candidatus Gracilibacteria bacterium]|nr:hypothetical protein [Candidatus Gracilibacteria bacterium]
MQYLLYIIAIPFLFINYKIIWSDLKEKKIPNKYLVYLLSLIPFYYVYLFFSFPEINYLLFLAQILLTLFISFILYNFGIWSAGDAKYLLVLALFIPHIGIIPFIGNIAIITLTYLFVYFIWFYIGKCLFNWKYSKSLYLNIYIDLREKWVIKKNNSKSNSFFIILKWLIIFLIIFVSLRLIRLYLFDGIFENTGNNDIGIIKEIIEKYHIYIFIGFLALFIGLLWLIKWLINKVKTYIINRFKKSIFKKYNLSSEFVDNIFLSILFFILTSFIIFEYIKNPYEIKNYLIRIFTIYLLIWILFKILFYMYKISFSIAETYYIDIKNLGEGDIVDKKYLVKIFGEQKSLGFVKTINNENDKKLLLYPNPAEYFLKIKNPIDKETLKKLNKIYKIANTYHKKNTPNYKNLNKIKIFFTFAFGGYILLGFIISFLYGNEIFKIIFSYTQEILKYIYKY